MVSNLTHSLDSCLSSIAIAKRLGADAADAISYHTIDHAASWRMGAQDGLERAESAGIGLRVFIGERQAMVSSTDLTTPALEEMAELVIAMAQQTMPDPHSALAPFELLAQEFPALDLVDESEPEPQWILTQCREAEGAALAMPGITNSEGADASFNASSITLATSNGFAQSYRSSHYSISVSVLAGSGTQMERDYDYASVRHRVDLPSAASIGEEAGRRAASRLNPRRVATCRAPIIFDPRVAKGLLGQVAQALSGSSIARGTSFLKDRMGQSIFPSHITIIDHPHLPRALGSKPFDGEGLANPALTLIEQGVVKEWLLDTRSAHQLGLTPNGRASRGLGSQPSPSVSNLFMSPGMLTPAALMADIQSGFYVTDLFGMGVNLITGDYSQGASGFWIENGQITYAVSEVTIAGNLKEMFLGLTPANDLIFRYAINAPTLRIESMTVAGI